MTEQEWAEHYTRYESILRGNRQHTTSHAQQHDFLEAMKGRNFGAREMLDAFDWFVLGWLAGRK